MMRLRGGVERQTISHDIARPVESGLIGVGRQMTRKGAQFVWHISAQETGVMGDELRHRRHEIAELGGRREARNGHARRLFSQWFGGDGNFPPGRAQSGARRLAAMRAEYRLMNLFDGLGALHGFRRLRRRQGKVRPARGSASADMLRRCVKWRHSMR